MQLAQKGASANVGGFKQLMVSMKWSTPIDFDLAAAYVAKDGREGLVYFGDLGDLNVFPFIQLSGDEGVGDKGGENEETLRITKLVDMKYVWIFCWDYSQVQAGANARFKESDITLSVIDDTGNNHLVKLDPSINGNTALIATIDCSSPIGSKLINTSKASTLNGLNDLQQLLDIAQS